jgi:MFS family permease
MATTSAASELSQPAHWYSGLTHKHWRTLWGSFLGWTFDGYEALILVVTLPAVLRSILTPEQLQTPAVYAGLLIGVTYGSWGLGGLIGGIAADVFGRKITMMGAILGYALFSGLTALSTDLYMFIGFRFLTGLAMGSEWSSGISLVAESWPTRARAKGVSFLQSGYGWGGLLASLVWFGLVSTNWLGNETWRLAYLVGALPALLVFYLRREMEESERWLAVVQIEKDNASKAAAAGTVETVRRRNPLVVLFADVTAARRTLVAFLLALCTASAWFVVVTFLPAYGEQLAKAGGWQPGIWGARISTIFVVGGILAYFLAGFIADLIGRRLFLVLGYGGALITNVIAFSFTGSVETFAALVFLNGIFCFGFAYCWMAIYLVELFPSKIRATASSLVFNTSRVLAALAPIVAGQLISYTHSVPQTVMAFCVFYLGGLLLPWLLPETKGKELPD